MGRGHAALSPTDYTSAETFDRECRLLFTKTWTPVCRSDELGPAGIQKAVTVAAQPVLLTRDHAGNLHALSNVCRHRGSILVDMEACADLIRCPYHLWTYRLDGSLAAAPFMGGADLGGCSLPHYAVEEWGGFVFVDLSCKTEPLAQWIAPLARALDPALLASRKIGFRLTFDHDWNWKVMVENFGESYHHIGTHAETLQPLWPGGQTDSSPSGGGWIEIRHPDHPEAGTLLVSVVFPLFLVATTTADDAVFWYRITPLAAERIALEITGLYPPEAARDRDRMEHAKAQVLNVHLEDIAACARVQAGLRASDAILGPLSPLELGIGCFRDWVSVSLSRERPP